MYVFAQAKNKQKNPYSLTAAKSSYKQRKCCCIMIWVVLHSTVFIVYIIKMNTIFMMYNFL